MLLIVFKIHRDLAYIDCVYLFIGNVSILVACALGCRVRLLERFVFCLDIPYSLVATLCEVVLPENKNCLVCV